MNKSCLLFIRLMPAWLLVFVSPLSSTSVHAADSSSPLRVGVAPTMPPMIFKEGGKFVGAEADLAQVLGRELHRSVTFVELDWIDLLDALEAGKIDIVMSSMSITRARLARFAFSDPYLRVGQMALVRADDKFRFSPLGSGLGSQKVGLIKGTTADLLAQQEFPRAKRKYYKSGEEAAQALAKKKIDAYISDSTMIWYLAGKYETEGLVVASTVFSDETLAWPMRRSDQGLVDSVNQALKSMNQSGELNQVLKRWMPKLQ